MKDNKPLLFINSAQSEKFTDGNQYVYDSRYNKKDKRLSEIKKEEVPIEELEEKVEEKIEVIEQVENNVTKEKDLDEEISKEKNKKLMNKIELLNKRASLERYVLVSVETVDKVVEGFFMKSVDNIIIINTEEGKNEIFINDIKDITIIKV